MPGNGEELVQGASTLTRMGEKGDLQRFFNGKMETVMGLDRPTTDAGALSRSEAGGDVVGIDAPFGRGHHIAATVAGRRATDRGGRGASDRSHVPAADGEARPDILAEA
jgi:hypothetical protein